MSTSDQDHPGGEAATPDEPDAAAASTPSDEPTAVVTEPTAAGAEPVPAEPTAVVAETPESLDTGRHVVVRPAPVPPEPVVPDPVIAPVVVPVVTPVVAAAPAPSPAVPEPVVAYAAITPTPPADDDHLFPDPNAPRSPSAGSHVLGVIVGLLLGPVAIGVLLLGESQVLKAQVDSWDATTDVLGIVLVTLGLLLLGCILLLGLWTAAVPITSGSLLTVAGAVYLYAPSVARDQTLHILTSSGWRLTVTQVTVAATSGMVFVAGVLLLVAGIVIASARRRGVHLGEFRERNRA